MCPPTKELAWLHQRRRAREKEPGADFLFGLREAFGVSIDWLLSGDGVMFGGHGIDLELLR